VDVPRVPKFEEASFSFSCSARGEDRSERLEGLLSLALKVVIALV
jgi:hypothetical protein